MKAIFYFKTYCVSMLAIAAVAMMVGCGADSFTKSHINGPWIHDVLSDGESAGKVENGAFVKGGWSPGADGSITYSMPGVPQGSVDVLVSNLSRSRQESIFITMYEPAELDYADPYIIHNPFRVAVELNHFQDAPRVPFDFLWTINYYPAGTDPMDRYTVGVPADGEGYEAVKSAKFAPVMPGASHHIKIDWKHGRAKLLLDGEELCEHVFLPLQYKPKAIHVVVGKSPGAAQFDLGDIVIKQVDISLPGV